MAIKTVKPSVAHRQYFFRKWGTVEFYHDKLFISEIVGIALEARKKRRYLNDVDTDKYSKIENDLLDVAQFIHEDITNEA